MLYIFIYLVCLHMCATVCCAEVREPEERVSWLLLTLWVQGIKLKMSDLAVGALLTKPPGQTKVLFYLILFE